jgi:hypothetical protein
MNPGMENPFDSIESAHEFLRLLAATISEAKQELEADVVREELNPSRRLDVLRVALYNVKKLEGDINRSGKLLNDLRILRRLLFEERTQSRAASATLSERAPQSTVAA